MQILKPYLHDVSVTILKYANYRRLQIAKQIGVGKENSPIPYLSQIFNIFMPVGFLQLLNALIPILGTQLSFTSEF